MKIDEAHIPLHCCWIFIVTICLLAIFSMIFFPSRASGDWLTEWNDTSIINVDSMPYTIPQSNMLILIDSCIEDDTLTVVGNGVDYICIRGYNGNHQDTIKYGQGGTKYAFGIFGKFSLDNWQIEDLVIVHDVDNAVEGDTASYCAGIKMLSGDSVKIEDVYIINRGYQSEGIDMSSVWGNGVKNVWLNRVTDSCDAHSISNRMNYNGSGFKITAAGSSLDEGEYTVKLDTCRLLNQIHCGCFFTSQYSATTYDPLVYMDACSVWVDVRNQNYSGINANGDPFGITFYRAKAGSYVHNCYVNGMAVNGEGGNGIMLQGMHGTEGNPIDIWGNIFIANFRKLPITGTGQYAIAMYFRWDQGGDNQYNQYVKIHNNLMYAYGNYTDYPRRIELFRCHFDSAFVGNDFYNNRCFAIQEDSTSGNDIDIRCIIIAKPDTAGSFKESEVIMGTTCYVSDVAASIGVNRFYNNYIYSHGGNFAFGSEPQHTHNSSYFTSHQDTIEAHYRTSVADADTFAFQFWQGGSYKSHGIGNLIIDPVFIGDAGEYVDFGTITELDDGLGKNVGFARIVDIVVVDSNLDPINGASVEYHNGYGQTVSSGSTNASGEYEDTVTYKRLRYDSPACSDSGTCWGADSTGYSTVWAVASYGDETDSTELTIDATTSYGDTIELSAGVGSGGKKLLIKIGWIYETNYNCTVSPLWAITRIR